MVFNYTMTRLPNSTFLSIFLSFSPTKADARPRALAYLAGVGSSGFLRLESGHLSFAVLDLAQVAQNLGLHRDVLLLVDFAAFQFHLQFQQALFDGSVVGILFFRNAGQRAENKFHAVNGHKQKIVNQKHKFDLRSTIYDFRSYFALLPSYLRRCASLQLQPYIHEVIRGPWAGIFKIEPVAEFLRDFIDSGVERRLSFALDQECGVHDHFIANGLVIARSYAHRAQPIVNFPHKIR